MSMEGVRPFINKCRTLRALRNVGRCLQIFVAERYDADAFQVLKQNGIIPATPANLFGEEVASGLAELSSVLNNAATLSQVDPAQFDNLFRKLGKIDGAARQLRGTLFEYLAADILRKSPLAAEIRMNRIYKRGEEKAEADVVAIEGNRRITFVECKGHSPYGATPDDEVIRWLQRSVPIFFSAIKAHPDWRNLEVRFEFWTTAPLSETAVEFLEAARSSINPSRYTIHWRLSSDIRSLCKMTNEAELEKAFCKHFMKVSERASA